MFIFPQEIYNCHVQRYEAHYNKIKPIGNCFVSYVFIVTYTNYSHTCYIVTTRFYERLDETVVTNSLVKSQLSIGVRKH